MTTYKKKTSKRQDFAHRLLFYLAMRTSPKAPEWRDATIEFLWDLYEIRDRNPAIAIVVHKEDGVVVYHDSTPLGYFHFRQRHILVHAAPGYLLCSKRNCPFSTRHNGSWPLMWRCKERDELKSFARIVNGLPVKMPMLINGAATRYIPQEVREFVLERDRGCCSVCKAKTNLHFDHVLPFSRGGDSLDPKNIQILCRAHNLQKGSSLMY